ncbi:TrbG/VirB9 family P-type conjugative transfer protein [Pseudomonas aeruginosa]|uniref:TrbG/VirB9 family P-type conjugative transfer protein n=1 Tax=Pseudomonas aeruginosa TaxID=287 RepID=UPI000EACFED5|nr:TrbG/VirB9 family P-type conjugative transfer protein [Pseudomonas aeruginosa]EKW1630273.1 TrbG/VirB9 family P-type conjugative transfer protein [Pseudomonas aeruginosa]
MKRNIALAAALAVALSTGPAWAVNPKTDSPYDYRIKTVVYNPMDVVELDGVVGLQTHIQFAPDEVYVTHNFGAQDSWQLTYKDNNVFIRPVAELSDTNLTVVTNKRTYYFLLRYIGSKPVKGEDGKVRDAFITTPWTMRKATVGVIFKYPFEDMKVANKKLEDRRVREALAKASNGPFNVDYRRSDDKQTRDIVPKHVWDDFRSTYFEFPANAPLPVVSVIGADGQETIVATHIEGQYSNIIVAETTAREWRVRLGDRVVGVVNGGYNPELGASSTGTNTPEVKRVPKGGDE